MSRRLCEDWYQKANCTKYISMAWQVELKCPLFRGYRGWFQETRVMASGPQRGLLVEYFSVSSACRWMTSPQGEIWSGFNYFHNFLSTCGENRSSAGVCRSNQYKYQSSVHKRLQGSGWFCDVWLKVHIRGDAVPEGYHLTVPCWDWLTLK